jgi:hypothetical protein
LQVALPTADAALNNRFSANYALGPYYLSNAPASAWRTGHDGNGGRAYVVLNRTTVTGTQFVFCSYTPASAGWALVSSGDSLVGVVRDAAGAIVVQATSAAGVVATGASSNSISHAAADTPDMTVERNGASVATANATGGLAPGDSGSTMVLGALSGGIAPLNAKVAMSLFFNRIPSAADDAVVAAYIFAKFGQVA